MNLRDDIGPFGDGGRGFGMGVKVVVVALMAGLLPLLVWPVVKPMWLQYNEVVQDCVDDTPKRRRTPKQDESCKSRGGWMIPGVNY